MIRLVLGQNPLISTLSARAGGDTGQRIMFRGADISTLSARAGGDIKHTQICSGMFVNIG